MAFYARDTSPTEAQRRGIRARAHPGRESKSDALLHQSKWVPEICPHPTRSRPGAAQRWSGVPGVGSSTWKATDAARLGPDAAARNGAPKAVASGREGGPPTARLAARPERPKLAVRRARRRPEPVHARGSPRGAAFCSSRPGGKGTHRRESWRARGSRVHSSGSGRRGSGRSWLRREEGGQSRSLADPRRGRGGGRRWTGSELGGGVRLH